MYLIHRYADRSYTEKDGQGYLTIWYRKLSFPRQYLPDSASKDTLVGLKVDDIMKNLIQRSRDFDITNRAGSTKRANINAFSFGDMPQYNDFAEADWTGFEVKANNSDELTIVEVDMKGSTSGNASFSNTPAWEEEMHLKFNICSEALSYSTVYFVKYDPLTRLIINVSTTWPVDTSYTVILYEDCSITKNFDITSLAYETKAPNGNKCGLIKFNLESGSSTPTFYIWAPDASNAAYTMKTRDGSFTMSGYSSGTGSPMFSNSTECKDVVQYLNRHNDSCYYRSGVVMLSQTHQETEVYSRL